MREGCNFSRPRVVSRRSRLFDPFIPLCVAIVLFVQCAPGTENEVISRCAMALDSFHNRCEAEGVSSDVLPTSVEACEDNEDDYEFFLECYDKSSSCGDYKRCLRDADDDGDDDDDASDDVWEDSASGLMWQVESTGNKNWYDAVDHCEGLSLDGYSDWRLPTISELRSLIRSCPATETGGSCGVTDSCLSFDPCWEVSCDDGCSSGDGPAGGCYWPSQLGGECFGFWSSSAIADVVNVAWAVSFYDGSVYYVGVDLIHNVRCVR